ncbi:hypothetical protein E2C01_081291 [Portunus trituberculatus]|uniref:Uncharacterized protein n=1 Tax=Portunus trituberculatus TaxID=210409 RepID=A0A5B7IRJ7_PORTR|nr:hypothetical protein [Portunus trituberculatus]
MEIRWFSEQIQSDQRRQDTFREARRAVSVPVGKFAGALAVKVAILKEEQEKEEEEEEEEKKK